MTSLTRLEAIMVDLRDDGMDADADCIADAIAEIKRAREAGKCGDCRGLGKRWYSLYGMAGCDTCRGTGWRA